MCTAATYKTKCFYFGRNLDYERGFGEQVVITPRLFPLPMRHLPDLTRHYAMIGMASVQDGYPLYYDAVNEKGLCMAGLNFVRSAVYGPCAAGKANVAGGEPHHRRRLSAGAAPGPAALAAGGPGAVLRGRADGGGPAGL